MGGDDFRDQLVQVFLSEHAAALGVDPLRPPPALLERVARQAELAKCTLSNAAQAVMCIVWQEREHRWTLTAADLERHCEALLARVARPIQRALSDARLRSGELDEIVLVGGATRMPMIRKLVRALSVRGDEPRRGHCERRGHPGGARAAQRGVTRCRHDRRMSVHPGSGSVATDRGNVSSSRCHRPQAIA